MPLELNHATSQPATDSVNSPSAQPQPRISPEDFFLAVIAGDSAAVSDMLATGGVDLRALREEDGRTVLHAAIIFGHGDIVDALLEKIGDDPTLLNHRDRDGYSPLACAAGLKNLRIMQALIKAGATLGDSAPNAATVRLASYMLEARGNYTDALHLALSNSSYGEDSLLLAEAGADTKDVLQRFLQEINRFYPRRHEHRLQFLLNNGVIDQKEVEIVLNRLVDDKNIPAIAAMLWANASATELLKDYARWGQLDNARTLFEAGAYADHALYDIIDDPALAVDEKVARLRNLIRAGAGPAVDRVLETLAEEKNWQAYQFTTRSIPGDALMEAGRGGDLRAARALIQDGADVSNAMSALLNNKEQDAANVLAIALAVTERPYN